MLRWAGPAKARCTRDPFRVVDDFAFHDMAYSNRRLDVATKIAVLRAAPSVVCLISHIGDEPLNICSGTIIECEEIDGIFLGSIVTAATLVEVPNVEVQVYLSDGKLLDGKVHNCDFHYNIAVVRIKSSEQLPVASIRHVDFTVKRGPDKVSNHGKVATGLGHYHDDGLADASPFIICATETVSVIALGRYCKEPYHIMAAPGIFSSDPCSSGCKELFRTSCIVSKNGIGGPLINRIGEVIGMNFYDVDHTPVLPINLVLKCFECLKNYRSVPRPWIGVEATYIHLIGLDAMQKIKKRTHGIVKGVLVKKVEHDSPGHRAGIRTKDVIIKCGGNYVGSPSELVASLWENNGERVEMLIFRPRVNRFLEPSLDSVGIHPDQYSWQVRERPKLKTITEVLENWPRLDVA